MNRREFIKLSAISATALFTSTSLFGRIIHQPVQIMAGSQLLRAMPDGRILTSRDSGKSWEQLNAFGEDVSVMSLSIDRSEQVLAQLEYQGFIFHLKLAPDGRNWVSI
jgi:hypothetical protein